MNLKEQRIYDTCNPKWYMQNWDGEYMAIEDDFKDEATFLWFKCHIDHLDDVFPASWSSNQEEILDMLYADDKAFYDLIGLAMAGEEFCHNYQSETLFQSGEEKDWLWLYVMTTEESGDEKVIAEFWRDILYRYAENDLRELFQEGYDNVI